VNEPSVTLEEVGRNHRSDGQDDRKQARHLTHPVVEHIADEMTELS
jgi:hypothetical protein